MFDTVNFTCPECYSNIPVQSKAGKCLLADIDALNTPVEIAATLVGRTITCEKCTKVFEVRAPLLLRRTPLELRLAGAGAVDDGYDNAW